MDILPQDSTPRKQCHGPCGRTLPATAEYFHKCKANKDGLQYMCKNCRLEYDNLHREHKSATSKAHYSQPEVKERHHANERTRRNNPETREDFLATKRASYYRPNVQARLKAYYSRPGVQAHKRANEHKRYHDSEVGPRVHEQKRTRTLNRIARKKAASGTYTVQDIQEQYDRQKHKCYYCQRKIKWGKHHVDHVIPLSRGGSNDISNLVIACPTCNMRKHNKLPHEWPEGGRLL